MDGIKNTAPVRTHVIHRNGYFEVSLEVQPSTRVIRVLDNFTLADCLIEQDFSDKSRKTSCIFQLLKRSPVGDVCLQYHGDIFWLRIRSVKATAAEALISAFRKEKAKTASTTPLKRVLRAPLPGLVVSMPVTVGQFVEAGQELCTLESMKMRNSLNAALPGVVSLIMILRYLKVIGTCLNNESFPLFEIKKAEI